MTSEQPAIHWHDECRQAAALFEKGECDASAKIFRSIIDRKEIAETDRALMCLNLGRVYAKLGDPVQSTAAFEEAAGLAIRPYVFVQESRIGFLYEQRGTTRSFTFLSICFRCDSCPMIAGSPVSRI